MGQLKWAFCFAIVMAALAGKCGAEDQGVGQQAPGNPPVEQPNFSADEVADRSRGQSLSTPSQRQAEEQIESALDQPLRSPIDFIDTPLTTLMGVIAEEYDLPIQFDKAALEAAAESPDAQVSVNVRDVSLRSAMDLTLTAMPQLTYIIDNEMLLITTNDEASKRLQTRVYQIDDLIPRRVGPARKVEANEPPQFVPIVDVITRCIERDSWVANKTGEGEICVVEPGAMVVTQTQRVHREIERLLATIRRVKLAIDRGDPAAAAVSMNVEPTAQSDRHAPATTATSTTRPAAQSPFGGQ